MARLLFVRGVRLPDLAGGDGTATAGVDYGTASGTVTFVPGTTTQTITVVVTGDLTNEANETFTVTLSNPTNATLGTDVGVGTIVNDDGAPTINLSDVSVTEPDSGFTAAGFTATLSAPSAQVVTVDFATADGTAGAGVDYTAASGTATFAPGVTSQTVTVQYTTGDGTARAGSDYTAASGTLTFGPGETTRTITVLVTGDATHEGDQVFQVPLSAAVNATIGDDTGVGTITNDDAVPTLSIAGPGSVVEGDSGSVNATFTVALSPASDTTVGVNYTTADGTARAGVDYGAASGNLP